MAIKCPKCQTENPDTLKFCGECGTQLSPSKGLDISKTMTLETPVEGLTRGTLFAGRYEIIEEFGKGGMGRVYKVFDMEVQAKRPPAVWEKTCVFIKTKGGYLCPIKSSK